MTAPQPIRTQGSPYNDDEEPAPRTGAALLDAVLQALIRYVVFPSPEAADAVTLWAVVTHALDSFQHATRLVVRSPEKRCGKSRLLDLLFALVFNPLLTVNATTAAIFRKVGPVRPPTLLMDEADALWGTKRSSELNEDLRALVNAGFQRNRPVLRCDGPHNRPREFQTFAMVALAGIGDLPDTITDRAVVVTLRRRARHEFVHAFRQRRDAEPLHRLRDEIAEWAKTVREELKVAEPAMPLEDRAADTWEPLIAIADAAGGTWPERARNAALVMTREATEADADAHLGVVLLRDIKVAFTEANAAVLATADLVERLKRVEESPWRAFDLDARGLAWRLRDYGVKPKQVRPDGLKQVRGYEREAFEDAFVRYLPTTFAAGASQTVTPSKAHVSGERTESRVTDPSVTTDESVTDPRAADLRKRPTSDGVTGCDNPPAPGRRVPPTPTRNATRSATGPCAVCRKPIPNRYGDNASTLCDGCRGNRP